MSLSSSYISLSRFLGDDRGNIAIAFGLAAIPAFTLVGAAIDMARAYQTQTQMQTVLDAATLAAANEYASSGSASAAEARLQAYVNAGLAQYGMAQATANANATPGQTTTVAGGTVGGVSLTNTTFNTTTQSIAPTLSVQVGTTVLGLVGVRNMGASVSSSASTASSGQKVEVSMMIDLTGSMGWAAAGDSSTKIANLKLAAQDMLNILMPATGDAKARIAVAPFADYVNAGPYAAAATGQAATGSYTNIANLASTKNGPFAGSYSGYYGSSASSQPAGSQAGTTSSNTTFSNGYCATPTYQEQQIRTYNGKTGPIGREADRRTPGAVRTDKDGYNGYWKQDGSSGGSFEWVRDDDDDDDHNWYVPVTTTSVTAGCEDTAVPTGQLITCVTERTQGNTYDQDDAPSAGKYVGNYNASPANGTPNKTNYSSNGKCYVAGRELPSVIPLTEDRATLDTFFNNATVGGATPGHLGTAWAWYLLSPNWNSIWPAASQASAYGGARKVVVLMTDGEYNTQYSNRSSRDQALALCTNMKAAGVEVYTVGFGFPQNTQSTDNSSAGKAMDLLTQCSSGNNHYYFPYNGTKLREAFTSIGNSIAAGQVTAQVRVSQ